MADNDGFDFGHLPLELGGPDDLGVLLADGTDLPLFDQGAGTPPTIISINPPPGANIDPSAHIEIQIQDEDGFGVIEIFVDQPEGRMVVFQNGQFIAPFAGSSTSNTPSERTLTVRRNGGWRAISNFYLRAQDAQGTEAT